jgi:hypothetical protein
LWRKAQRAVERQLEVGQPRGEVGLVHLGAAHRRVEVVPHEVLEAGGGWVSTRTFSSK